MNTKPVDLFLTLGLLLGGCNGTDPTAQGGAPATGSTSNASVGGSGGADPGIRIDGLSGPVEAVYDPNGLLHLTCSTDEDCFSALGYFHAQNRFFFMDFVRNLVRGRLGELVKAGNAVLERDFMNRRWFCTANGEPLEAKLYDDASLPAKGSLDAYTRGVNAWLSDMRAGRNDATLTTEYDFALIDKGAIRDWEAQDSTAVGLYVLDFLSNNSYVELADAEEVPKFSPALAKDLFSFRPLFDAFTTPGAANSDLRSATNRALDPHVSLLTPPNLELFRTARLALPTRQSRPMAAMSMGSNNWAVAKGRTATGRAMLANDSHLPLMNPSLWFPVEFDAMSKGTGRLHTQGHTFPGLPSTMAGRNRSIGWGVTAAYYDLADAYVETLADNGKSVMFQGQSVPILEKEFVFKNSATGESVTKTFRWVPHHGPILSENAAAGSAISVRWLGHAGGTDFDAFLELGMAESVSQAKTALKNVWSAGQNFVVVDKDNNIGWFPFGRVPTRPWASAVLAPWLPLPGGGDAEWGPAVPPNELPQLENPPAGAIATSNQDMTGATADGDPLNDGQAALQASAADGTRQRRILDLLSASGNAHTAETMRQMQGDSYSLWGEIVVPLVLSATTGQTLTKTEQELIAALNAWRYTCPTGLDGSDPVTAADSKDPKERDEAIGCTAFHATLHALLDAALGDEVKQASATWSFRQVTLLLRALKSPATITSGDLFWDDLSTAEVVESRSEILRRAVKLASVRLANSGPPNSWRWGRFHTLSLRSIFDNFSIATYNAPAVAAPGGAETLNAAFPNSIDLPAENSVFDFAFSGGPSVRFVVEVQPDGLEMTYQFPGGSDLHRDSPFYNNLLSKWLLNEPIPFPFGPGAVPNPAKVLLAMPR